MHPIQRPSIGTEDSDSMKHNLGNHLHCNHAIGRAQNSASRTDKHGRHILIESESENLARTSRIYHLLTVQGVNIVIRYY